MENYRRAGHTTDDNIKRSVRAARWITKATDTHSECVILIAFPHQHLLSGLSSMLRLYVQYLSRYNRYGVCLLRGTDWIFKYNSG